MSSRSPEETFARLMLAVAAVIIAARLVGALVARVGQPPVMGEVLAGILLGPSLLGWAIPPVAHYVFPPDITPLLGAAANIGLALFMFLVGAELDTTLLRGRARAAAAISNLSVVVPFVLGVGAGLLLYPHVGAGELVPGSRPPKELAFVVFMGVAMSITAFPVLSRILVERRMTHHPVATIALAAAAIDDVTAWALLAIAIGVSTNAGGSRPLEIIGLTIVLAVLVLTLGRRVLRRVATAFDEAGRIPTNWVAAIIVAVSCAAFAAGRIGVSPILGAFLVGLALPRRSDLTADLTRRMHDVITIVLLPLFFVVTGLRVDVRGLDSVGLWLLLAGLTAIAGAGKLGGAVAGARVAGLPRKHALATAVLMNTRGLTELIVLTIGHTLGVIPTPLFTVLVLVALITTFATAPLLRVVDRDGELQRTPEEELAAAGGPAVDRGAILVAPQAARNLTGLSELAAVLAAQPPRELILAGIVQARRQSTGPLLDQRALESLSRRVQDERARRTEAGADMRAVAFLSTTPGADVVRLAERENADLVLTDGRRSLLRRGVLGGEVGVVLERAPCDVAVVVERTGTLELDGRRPVLVPFGAKDHDWAALELGAWIAQATGSRLQLLGAAADPEQGRGDASRMLADASLMLQQVTGIAADTVLVAGGKGVLEKLPEGGLCVIGLPDDWRRRGLGDLRSTIAEEAPGPTVFVRRGRRPGALAPPDTITQFTWSSYAGAVAGATTSGES